MYYPHFGLKEPPFKITPNTDFFFSGANRGAVLDALLYAITNGEGIIKVVGEVGSGKTMLCRMLQTILPEKIESIYLANPSVAPEDVLHAIAFELQLKLAKNTDRLKVMQQLQAYLLSRHAEGRQVVIFVEEAQGMPLATLEEIRLLSNLETKQDKLLQIVLFGQPELDVNLSKPHIRQLRERITHSFHLAPLATKEVGEYLLLRLRAAGYQGPHLFSDMAIKKLSSAAKGLVRRVNILADKSLLAAFAENVYQVTPKHVKAAIQDSEFGRHVMDYKKYFVWIILLLAFLLVTLGNIGWQNQSQPKAMMQASINTLKNKIAEFLHINHPVVITQTEPTKIANPVVDTHAVNTKIANTAVTPVSEAVSVHAGSVASHAHPAESNLIAVQIPQQTAEIPVKPIEDTQALWLDKRLELTKSWLFSGQTNTITLQIKSIHNHAKDRDAKLGDKPIENERLKLKIDRIISN